MILEIIVGILGFSVVVLGFTTFNLLNKNEKAEDIIVSYQEHIDNLNEEIIKSEKRLNEIDQRGIFQSDDEIGWFFNEVKKIKRNLAKFKVDLSKLKKKPSVWYQDAEYKDVTGNASLSANETKEVTQALSKAGKIFQKIAGTPLRSLQSNPE